MKFSHLGTGRTQIENTHAAVEYTFYACLEGKLLVVLVQLLICRADWETQIDTAREILLRRMFHCKKVNPLNAELNPFCHLLALLGAHPILHVSRIRVKITKQLSTSLAQLRALTRFYCRCHCHIVVCVCGLFKNVSVAVTT